MNRQELPPKLGFIGLGAIGEICARHLLRESSGLVVYDRDPTRLSALVTAGATPAATPADLARSSEIVVLSLPNPAAVADVLTGQEGLLEAALPRSLVIDLSTIDPETSLRMYRAARERGVSYIEAPVSGGEPEGSGTDAARHAALSFMVGGDADSFERSLPILAVLGRRFFHLGPVGAGSTVKLISNLVAGLNNLVASEAFALGAAAGITPETLLEVFEGTDAKSYWMMEYFSRRLRDNDYAPGFSVDLQYKDHRLAAELAEKLGVHLDCNAVALRMYGAMQAAGRGGYDLVDAVRFLAERAGADIYDPPDGPIRVLKAVRR